jgi:hypothetical protein
MYERPEEYAKYWVEQAIHFCKMVGKDIALAEFSNPNGMFVQDDLYIFVLSTTGVMLAHGINEKFVGLDFLNVKDSDGKEFTKEIVDTAKNQGKGWVNYKWYHPRRNKVLPKMLYFQKENDLIFCSAVYNYED